MDGRIARLGKGLFGRPARLAVALWVLRSEHGVFSQHEVVQGVGLPQSNVREELERLVGLGLLRDVPPAGGPSRRYYSRVEGHPGWWVFRAADDAVTALDAAWDEPEPVGGEDR